MSAFRVSRMVIFSLVGMVNACVLALAIDIIVLAATNDDDDFGYAGYVVPISLMTMSAPAILFIQSMKRSAIMIVTEISWLGFLSLAWIAAAGFSVSFSVCFPNPEEKWYGKICAETGAMSGLAFFIVLALVGHVTALLVMSSLSQKHGSSVWKATVPTANFKLTTSHTHLEDSV